MKALERRLKRLLARLLAVVFWRPGRVRRARAALAEPRRILVVRVDDRVGEALLLTPVLERLRRLPTRPRVEVLVHPRVRRILDGHPAVDGLHVLPKAHVRLGPFAPVLRQLRRRRFDVVIDCGNWSEPSVTHAIVARIAGPRSAVIGPAVPPLSPLRTHPVVPRADTVREIAQRVHLLEPLVPDAGRAAPPMTFRRPRVASDAVRRLLERVERSPHAVVNPGGRLGWRRLPESVFTAATAALAAAGRTPIVTWGPGEEAMARRVAEAVPGAMTAPSTTLDELAALMAACGLTVCNNTGPMHLSVAVGAATLQLFLFMDPARWGHAGPPHRVLDLTPFPEHDRPLRTAEAVRALVEALDAPVAERLPHRPPAV